MSLSEKMHRRNFLKCLAGMGAGVTSVTALVGKSRQSAITQSVKPPLPVKRDPRTKPFVDEA